MTWKIRVIRTDDTVRDVEIMYDRNTDAYAFVNLTSHHICKCRFGSLKEAFADLFMNERVKSFNVINCNGEEIKP